MHANGPRMTAGGCATEDARPGKTKNPHSMVLECGFFIGTVSRRVPLAHDMVSKCQPGALPAGVRPFCSGGNRLLPGLSDSIYLAPVRALEALRVPDIELPVNKHIAPTPGTALELPHYHFLTSLEILGCVALPEDGHSRTLPLVPCPPVPTPQ